MLEFVCWLNKLAGLARWLKELFEMVQRVPITVGACQAIGEEEDLEELTVWRRRR